jgi:probable nitrogen fixation protein
MSTPHPSIIQALLQLMRSHDRSGAWDDEPDDLLLAPFIVTKAQKREMPLIGDPDPDILWRVELYYAAIAWEIEKRSGRAIVPMLQINHEGWGRVALIAGRLVAAIAHVRELHRFGFETLDQLADKAEKVVLEGVATIDKFPAVADA